MICIIWIPIVVEAKSIDMYVNSYNGLTIRSDPSEDGEEIGIINFGEKIKVKKRNTGEDKCWAKIKYDKHNGYVLMEFLQITNPFEDMEYLGNWHITAYTHTGNVCANGNYPTAWYTIACNSLDFGLEVYIKGIGKRTVEDRGPGWLENEWLDIFMDSYDECVNFGSQYLDVYLIKSEDE